jgi:hypothetical protein
MKRIADVLGALDERLSADIELTLYGRAAIALGFDSAPADAEMTVDVDVLLWIGQAEQLAETTDFWEAVADVNRRFAAEGLYMTHFFTEEQVVLRPCWRERCVPLRAPYRRLRLYRLSDEDLWLSKLMRDDPIDRRDAEFIARVNGWTRAYLERLIADARVPPVPEIQEAFRVCSARALEGHPV